MARNTASSFLKTIEQSSKDMRAIVEALRIFGYINEIEYSELNTELTILSTELVRADGAETIELARRLEEHGLKPLNMHNGESGLETSGNWDQAPIDPADIPGMIPREY
jgi:ribosomal protein S8